MSGGIKPLPEPMCWVDIIAIPHGAISQNKDNVCYQKLSSKIILLKIFMHLPRANVLRIQVSNSPALTT